MWALETWNNYTYSTIDNLLSPEECSEIIKACKQNKLIEATVQKGVDNSIRTSKIHWIDPLDTKNYPVYLRVCYGILESNKIFNYDLTYMEDIQFTEYAENDFYSVHKDSGENGSCSRKLSFVLQLTDPSEYEGGELLIYESSIKDPVIANKKQGSAILFPSYTLHEVKPVTKGIRNSLVCWVHGPKFK